MRLSHCPRILQLTVSFLHEWCEGQIVIRTLHQGNHFNAFFKIFIIFFIASLTGIYCRIKIGYVLEIKNEYMRKAFMLMINFLDDNEKSFKGKYLHLQYIQDATVNDFSELKCQNNVCCKMD